MGKSGRGIAEYAGVHPDEVDIFMGTFTKSFAGMGGYIAGSEDLINYLRQRSAGSMFSSTLSPIIVAQILAAFDVILGRDGTNLGQHKLKSLRENGNYLRQRLIEMGVEVLGDEDSPVVPIMLYSPSKVGAFSRECFERNIAVVTVGFPATPLLLARVRFCLSASHTKKDLDEALIHLEEICIKCHLRFRTHTFG